MTEKIRKMSYTSVRGAFPIKVIKNEKLLESIKKYKRIIPLHPKLNITNVCNLSCGFCSRGAVNRNLEMPWDKIAYIARAFHHLGSRAITLSGGGDPLTHRKINEIIETLHMMGFKIGMLTNGWLLSKLTGINLRRFTWIRVSSGDGREEGKKYWENLEKIVKKGDNVDWGLSYVLTRNPDLKLIETATKFANKNNFTHIRMISDLSIEDNESVETYVKKFLDRKGIKLATFQNQPSILGHKKCLIGLLKPVIDTDGRIYPCCNTQFATNSPTRDWVKEMSLGTIENIQEIFSEQKAFDGSKCRNCFSSQYNEILNMLLLDIKHEDFV